MYFVHSFSVCFLFFFATTLPSYCRHLQRKADGKELCELLVKLLRVTIEGLHSAKITVIEQE
jgi:hypothetical protein